MTLGGGAKGTADYIDLPDGILNALGDSITIELWATPHSVQYWSRIFDFGSSTSDSLFMGWTMGQNYDSDRVEWIGEDNGRVDNTNAPYELGVEYHIALVIDGPNNLVSWYSAPMDSLELGPARGSFTTTHRLSDLSWTNVWLGQSQWGDNTANASYNEFRIWQGALTNAELQKFHSLFQIIPPLPLGFYPENEQTDVELDVVFEWPGISLAKTYDLYVGTDVNAVNAATRNDATGALIAEYVVHC